LRGRGRLRLGNGNGGKAGGQQSGGHNVAKQFGHHHLSAVRSGVFHDGNTPNRA
jgi:hypothetical protein